MAITEPAEITISVTITTRPRADELAAELRKLQSALGHAYRNALLGNELQIWQPALQGIAAASINLEGAIMQLDPPRVVAGTDQAVRGLGRA
jgi:hypothetical protein